VPEPAQRAVLDKPRRLGDDLIFRSKRGNQFRQESQWRAWDPIRRTFIAGLPDTHHLRERVAADQQDQLDLYELRHFGASYMLNELELEPWVIAEQLRHSDGGRLVLDLYGHPDRDKAIDRIRRAYSEPSVIRSKGTSCTPPGGTRTRTPSSDRTRPRSSAERLVHRHAATLPHLRSIALPPLDNVPAVGASTTPAVGIRVR